MEQIKNSKGEVLPQPYLDLARMRREQNPNEHSKIGFTTVGSKEGWHFWNRVFFGDTPEIPAASLAELEEWKKERSNTDKSNYDFMKENYERITNSEPDWKAMYEELKNDYNILKSQYEIATMQTTELKSHDRNWVAECAMAAMQGYLANPSESDPGSKWVLQVLGLPENTKYDWLVHHPQFVAKLSFDYAEALAADGVKRGHLPKTDNA